MVIVIMMRMMEEMDKTTMSINWKISKRRKTTMMRVTVQLHNEVVALVTHL
jgi:hypothetical protein